MLTHSGEELVTDTEVTEGFLRFAVEETKFAVPMNAEFMSANFELGKKPRTEPIGVVVILADAVHPNRGEGYVWSGKRQAGGMP